jgi:cold shock CspA family protein
MLERSFGRIKFWNEDAGFGFIRCDDGSDLFVHVSNTGFLSPKVGDRVSYDLGTNPRTTKLEAKAVSILGDGEAKMENAT